MRNLNLRRNGKLYDDTETLARKNKVGLWAGKSPIAPWKFRKRKKSRSVVEDEEDLELYEEEKPVEEKTFKGYECTVDCSGHEAGYEWAEEQGIDDPDDCEGNSQSFIEGCRAFANGQ